MADYRYARSGKIEFSDHSRYYKFSSTSTAISKVPVRFVGFVCHDLTASGGNRVGYKIIDGSATSGTVVFDISASSPVTLGETYLFPNIQFDAGLVVDISGSATGVNAGLVFFVKDDA